MTRFLIVTVFTGMFLVLVGGCHEQGNGHGGSDKSHSHNH